MAGEEQGLLGATHWAEAAKQRGLNIAAMFTNDIVGNTPGGNGVRDNRRVRVFSEGVPPTETEAEARVRQSTGGENDCPSRQLARYIKEAGRPLRERISRSRSSSGATATGAAATTSPSSSAAIAAVRFTEPNEDFARQHQNVREEDGVKYGDVPEMVDFAYIAQVARVNAAALASAGAGARRRPPASASSGAVRSTTPTLRWKPNAEPDLAGYRVVWRETYEPFWGRARRGRQRQRVRHEGALEGRLLLRRRRRSTATATRACLPSRARRRARPGGKKRITRKRGRKNGTSGNTFMGFRFSR